MDAGVGHKNSGAGHSSLTGDYGAIFHAWKQAKESGIITLDDPIPTKALCYIAVKHKLIDSIDAEKERLPIKIYNQAIRIVENDY